MVVFLMSLWGLGVVKLSRRADGRYSLFGPELNVGTHVYTVTELIIFQEYRDSSLNRILCTGCALRSGLK